MVRIFATRSQQHVVTAAEAATAVAAIALCVRCHRQPQAEAETLCPKCSDRLVVEALTKGHYHRHAQFPAWSKW